MYNKKSLIIKDDHVDDLFALVIVAYKYYIKSLSYLTQLADKKKKKKTKKIVTQVPEPSCYHFYSDR